MMTPVIALRQNPWKMEWKMLALFLLFTVVFTASPVTGHNSENFSLFVGDQKRYVPVELIWNLS